MLKRRDARIDPCGTPFLRRCNLLRLLFQVVRVKLRLPTISMVMWTCLSHNQSQQLAGEAVMPCIVISCCEIDKHSSGFLLSRKAIFNVLIGLT